MKFHEKVIWRHVINWPFFYWKSQHVCLIERALSDIYLLHDLYSSLHSNLIMRVTCDSKQLINLLFYDNIKLCMIINYTITLGCFLSGFIFVIRTKVAVRDFLVIQFWSKFFNYSYFECWNHSNLRILWNHKAVFLKGKKCY